MRKELLKSEKFIVLLKRIAEGREIYDASGKLDGDLVCNVLECAMLVDRELYGCDWLAGLSLAEYAGDGEEFLEQLGRWLGRVTEELERQKTIRNQVDYDFHVFSNHIRTSGERELVNEALSCLLAIRKGSEANYEMIRRSYSELSYFWGAVDLDAGNIELLENRAHELKCHWEDFCWLYANLEDYRSKKVLYGILRFWLRFDVPYKNSIVERNFDDYYDYDIIRCNEEEVFVDLGAYNGDSALSFIENYGAYKRIYCYEMMEEPMEEMKKVLSGYDNVVFRQVGAGNVNGSRSVFRSEFPTNSMFTEQGDSEMPMVTLDEDIREPITFLKMDIEGGELEALKGARQHIQNDRPKLAICSYHNNHHIYEIPRLIKEYYPGYKLYMRYNGDMDDTFASEYVTFGIPE